MRSNVANYELIAPNSLDAVLQILADSPDRYTPIAGGTEIMVGLGAGRLQTQKLISLWNLEELRFIEAAPDAVVIGAGSTFADIRKHPVIADEFSILSEAASWTGSIANQNRGTLGGNIVNASPAADSLPALMVYEAELVLTSARGTRRMPYVEFHTGYKQTKLAADEIISAIALQPRFSGYHGYSRKVGTRNAQAIAKLCLAGLGKISGGQIDDVRLAIGSMAVTPVRLRRTEAVLLGQPYSAALMSEARQALESEVAPIDDIRSSALYRLHVAGNLLQEFLEGLFA